MILAVRVAFTAQFKSIKHPSILVFFTPLSVIKLFFLPPTNNSHYNISQPPNRTSKHWIKFKQLGNMHRWSIALDINLRVQFASMFTVTSRSTCTTIVVTITLLFGCLDLVHAEDSRNILGCDTTKGVMFNNVMKSHKSEARSTVSVPSI